MGTSNQKACGYHFFFDSFSTTGTAGGVCSGGIEKLDRQLPGCMSDSEEAAAVLSSP